jgi:hypothetical protein
MKKLITFISIVAIIIVTNNKIYGQEFLGIKVDGKLSEVVAKFKLKGFKVTSPDNLSPTLVGKAGISKVEVIILSTPITKTVYKIAVYLPKQNEWESIKSEYEDYLRTLTAKYGTPNNSFNFFGSPYKEGEGDEMNAITMEKCFYSAYWENVSISISEYRQVSIVYENSKNFTIRDREVAKLKKDAF